MSVADSIGFGLEGVQFTDHPMPVGKITFGVDQGGTDFSAIERRILARAEAGADYVRNYGVEKGTTTGRLPAKVLLTQAQLDQIGAYFGLTPWEPKPIANVVDIRSRIAA